MILQEMIVLSFHISDVKEMKITLLQLKSVGVNVSLTQVSVCMCVYCVFSKCYRNSFMHLWCSSTSVLIPCTIDDRTASKNQESVS